MDEERDERISGASMLKRALTAANVAIDISTSRWPSYALLFCEMAALAGPPKIDFCFAPQSERYTHDARRPPVRVQE
ncbi:hypothetical protein AWB79_06373 [Caballeronia hypogeia]|uniref:Uncharacterized protein n=1 Tax=Caballeronia hypogeia TaxID=1777140 RepID=A0A158D441_9BURK|nr:hypothetical protein AWB79_06373 [Caballeronia hypogeia]